MSLRARIEKGQLRYFSSNVEHRINEEGVLETYRVDFDGNEINLYQLGYEPDDRAFILEKIKHLPLIERESTGLEYKRLFRHFWDESIKLGHTENQHDVYAMAHTNRWLIEKVGSNAQY